MCGVGAIAEPLIDSDDLALKLLGFRVSRLLLHYVNQDGKHTCRVRVELAGFAQSAEKRAPDIRFAFADPALLHLGTPFQCQGPIRKPFQFSVGGLAFPLRNRLERSSIEYRGLMIAGLRLGRASARLIDARVTVFDDGLPGHSVNREHGPTLRFGQQRAIARGIRLRSVDVAGPQITHHSRVIQPE